MNLLKLSFGCSFVLNKIFSHRTRKVGFDLSQMCCSCPMISLIKRAWVVAGREQPLHVFGVLNNFSIGLNGNSRACRAALFLRRIRFNFIHKMALPSRQDGKKERVCKLSPALCIVSLVSKQNVVQSRGIFPSWSVATEDPEWTGMEMGETCTAIAPAVK